MFVDFIEVVLVLLLVKIDLVDLINYLPDERARLHIVIGVLKHSANDRGAWIRISGEYAIFKSFEKFAVDEIQEVVASHPFRIGRPIPPSQLLRDRRLILRIIKFPFFLFVVEDFQEEYPDELREALRVTVHASILAHNVLDRFDGVLK
jgi:hypothetical protein